MERKIKKSKKQLGQQEWIGTGRRQDVFIPLTSCLGGLYTVAFCQVANVLVLRLTVALKDYAARQLEPFSL